MMRSLFLLVILSGCGSFEPVGTYVGEGTRTSTATRQNNDAGDGPLTANTNRSNNTETEARVVVTRIDDNHLQLQIGDFCRLRAEQSPSPNDHQAQIVMPQMCPLEVEGWSGEVPVSGHVQFDRDDPHTIDLDITGSATRGDPNQAGHQTVSFSYSFLGERQR